MTHAKPPNGTHAPLDGPNAAESTTARPAPAIGVYLHFPWCLSKCGYCDFFSVAARPEAPIDHERYADQVIREFERRACAIARHRLTTVFLGGGTPSLWDTKAIGRVVSAVVRGFDTSVSEVEITVECNPSSFDQRVADGLLEAGVNRISLGVQSLDDAALEFLGRRHHRDGALAALKIALNSGFSSVSADLLFGLPQQTTAYEVEQVLAIAEMPVSHLSVYALTIEEGTYFGQLKKRGKLPLAVDERVADAFIAIHSALETQGFDHYEISNFARNGKRSLHNQQYWWGNSYLGLGTAAWGTLPIESRLVRYRNPANIERYLKLDFSSQGGAPFELAPKGTLEQLEYVDTSMRLQERLMLGLRLREGLDLEALGRELGVEVLTPERRRAIQRQVSRGNLVLTGARISIEPTAWLLADSTIADIA